ncbi:MAG: ATP synthase F1 subunit delta [Candidatus Cloacimonetes bacterium]|nr:ATP synthase F1 subunit delta [Candidatus Cloacimonadota bacterium]
MKNIIIAKRYAKAAMQTLNPEIYADILNQIQLMHDVFSNNEAIKRMLASAFVNKEKKLDFINEITELVKNREFWRKSLTVLVLKNRSSIMKLFFIELEEMLYKELNQKKVDIIFARNQDSETIENVKKEVEKILHKNIVCDVHIDKDIIGGFIAIDKNTIIDASVRSNLNRFAKTVGEHA